MKIGQISEMTGLSTHTIRYYEKQGLINAAAKDSSGHRDYGPDDIELLNWVDCLKNSGMSLALIRRYSDAVRSGDQPTQQEILSLHLQQLRLKQQDIHHYIEVTEKKLRRFSP
ncbi:MerR family transcriptional regulator [Bacterioplanes sanyensis]|uniref:MerR family transcriptional regulator n=1 Tax=Bacterioplanes sanyensis TaxID=1249553 RepID=A0A222FNF2_9GAMM|nr:MerR family transcriptional regulator [Bacterioplanes sanyensis]ASP40212.1 MerR family transcriptional regulator [Bacterioplanes sanyensis]